jgi:hypothetical protein
MLDGWRLASDIFALLKRQAQKNPAPVNRAGLGRNPTSNYGLAFVFFAIVKDKGVLFVENVKSLLQPIKASTLARCGPNLFA